MKTCWYVFGIILGLIVMYVCSYLIAVSDLPEWFKFFLLK